MFGFLDYCGGFFLVQVKILAITKKQVRFLVYTRDSYILYTRKEIVRNNIPNEAKNNKCQLK